MKKHLAVATFLVGIVIFGYSLRWSLYSLTTDVQVEGLRYWSIRPEGKFTNGFSYLIFQDPFLFGRELKPWQACTGLHPRIAQYLASSSWSEITSPIEILREEKTDGYKAYLRSGEIIAYVRGFPDYGGDPPAEDEAFICANK